MINSNSEDRVLGLRIGNETFPVETSACFRGYPSEDEYPHSFPIASIVELNHDFYEPPATVGLETHEKYWALRSQSSRPMEQAAILLAMAQAQANVLPLNRFQPDLHQDHKLQTLQVSDIIDS
jgi:hypothetical protein